jgi:hypothetical protein
MWSAWLRPARIEAATAKQQHDNPVFTDAGGDAVATFPLAAVQAPSVDSDQPDSAIIPVKRGFR